MTTITITTVITSDITIITTLTINSTVITMIVLDSRLFGPTREAETPILQ